MVAPPVSFTVATSVVVSASEAKNAQDEKRSAHAMMRRREKERQEKHMKKVIKRRERVIERREAKRAELKKEREKSCGTKVGDFCETVCGYRFLLGGNRNTRTDEKEEWGVLPLESGIASKYQFIINPLTGRKVHIKGKIGEKVLLNYLFQIGN